MPAAFNIDALRYALFAMFPMCSTVGTRPFLSANEAIQGFAANTGCFVIERDRTSNRFGGAAGGCLTTRTTIEEARESERWAENDARQPLRPEQVRDDRADLIDGARGSA